MISEIYFVLCLFILIYVTLALLPLKPHQTTATTTTSSRGSTPLSSSSRRHFLDSLARRAPIATAGLVSVLHPAGEKILANASPDSDDFRTKARAEYTNSITASRDTNISPKEAYDSILNFLSSNQNDGAESTKLALDVGAGAGLSTSYLFHELGYKHIDAVDWSGDAWRSNVEQTPSSVRFFELDDDSFFGTVADKEERKYDVICYNFAINPSKAVRVARQYLTETGVLFAPVNDRPEYWYKQTYYKFNVNGQVVQKSQADVGAWSVQFQPDVTSDTCIGIWCGNTNGFFAKRQARSGF